MLIVGKLAIGDNFVQAEVGERVKGYFQYLSMMDGKWKMSTYETYEKYTVPFDKAIYRRPINIKGWIEISIPLIKKYWKKMINKITGRK